MVIVKANILNTYLLKRYKLKNEKKGITTYEVYSMGENKEILGILALLIAGAKKELHIKEIRGSEILKRFYEVYSEDKKKAIELLWKQIEENRIYEKYFEKNKEKLEKLYEIIFKDRDIERYNKEAREIYKEIREMANREIKYDESIIYLEKAFKKKEDLERFCEKIEREIEKENVCDI